MTDQPTKQNEPKIEKPNYYLFQYAPLIQAKKNTFKDTLYVFARYIQLFLFYLLQMYPIFRFLSIFLFLGVGSASFCVAQHYVFFLHNRFLEGHKIGAYSKEYNCKIEYLEILDSLRSAGFIVISEKRPENTDAYQYAQKIVNQIDSLKALGVKSAQISVVGTSKGGYIAQYVGNILKDKEMKFVLIGSCSGDNSAVEFYGNVLSIYEESDSIAQDCRLMRKKSLGLNDYKEIVLHTGKRHGFLYQALPEWLHPTIAWIRQNHSFPHNLNFRMDSLFQAANTYPFNGNILIQQGENEIFSQSMGYFSINSGQKLKREDEFIIGSISKQITAVLALREYDKGKLDLFVPIRKYLPKLPQKWADSVNLHQLLTHTHGINEDRSENLLFRPGTQYKYSQVGMEIIGEIVAAVSGKSFQQISEELFQFCGMTHSFHLDSGKAKNLARAHDYEKDLSLMETMTETDIPVAAGGFISSAPDLLKWNQALHTGKLLTPETYNKMMTAYPNAIRDHLIFGKTYYGYGITVAVPPALSQLGQTGFFPGFASLNFYFPETQTSIIILSNAIYDTNDLRNTFEYHTKIYKMTQDFLKNK